MKSIHQFMIDDRQNLIDLVARMKETYGRLPAEIVVGPQVTYPFAEDVSFFEIPVVFDASVGDNVLALLSDTTIFDRRAAQGLSREQRKLMVDKAMGRVQ